MRFAPGTFLEQTKIVETTSMNFDGEYLQYRTLEVAPTLGRNLSAKGRAQADL